MKTALDTNILSTIWSAQPMQNVVRAALNALRDDGTLVISPLVYAESLAHPNYSEDGINHFLSVTGIAVDMPLLDTVWTEAGRRYRQYAVRRRQFPTEPPRRILADFLVGAHARLHADQLITLDVKFYRTNFPELRLYPLPELQQE
jgi:predicted nucleic acid-binding protein